MFELGKASAAPRLIGALSLGVVALVLRQFPLQLLGDGTPEFWLGGGLVLMSFVLYGEGGGLLTALVSVVSFLARGGAEGLAMLVHVAEAWAVYRIHRRYGSLVFSAAAFWLTAGWLMDGIVYGWWLGHEPGYLGLLLLKHGFNSVLGALGAELLLVAAGTGPLASPRPPAPGIALRSYFQNRTMFLVAAPALALGIVHTRATYQAGVDALQRQQDDQAGQLTADVSGFLRERSHGLAMLARLVEMEWGGRPRPSARIAAHLAADPALQVVGLADADGALVDVAPGSHALGLPPRAGSVAHTPYFQEARASLRGAYAHRVRAAPGLPQAPEPVVTIAEPLLGPEGRFAGLLFAAIPDSRLAALLAARGPDRHRLTVLDAAGAVVASSDAGLGPGTAGSDLFPMDLVWRGGSERFTHRGPAEAPASDRAQLWHAVRRQLAAPGWTLVGEIPDAELHAALLPTVLRTLWVMLALSLLLYMLAFRFTRAASTRLMEITRAAAALAEPGPDGREAISALERSPLRELREVATQLEAVEASLSREREHSEHALAQAAERLAAAVDAAPIVLWSLDREGVFTLSEGRGLETLGLRPGELVGRSVFEHYADNPQVLTDTRRALAGESFRSVTRVGEHVFDCRYAPLRAKDGRIVGLTGVAADVTQQRKAEEALRLSEERFRFVVENAPVCIHEIGADGSVLSMNPAGLRMLGVAAGEEAVRGTPYLSLVGEADRERVRGLVERAFAGVACEFGFVGAAATPEEAGVFRSSLIPVRDGEGTVVKLVGVSQDVTEAVRAREELERSEERFEKAFRASPTGMSLSSLATGRFLDVNDRFLKLSGYGRQELVGQVVSAFGLWAEPAERERVMELLERKGAVHQLPARFRVKGGGVLEGLGSFIKLEVAGEPCVLALIEDVTERRELEERLRQAQKMEAIGRLAGGIAHDFNNLLTALLGHSELALRSTPVDDPNRRHLEAVAGAGERARSLTAQLLAFSRKQVLKPTVLDLKELLSNLQPMLRRLISEDVELELSVSPDPGPVIADRGQIEQVVLNLAVNARDAMPHGGRLSLEVADDEWPGSEARPQERCVRLSVSDTGVGMDARTQAMIFEPFFTTKDVGQGTGLGLATVHGIVAQSKGTIRVQSEPGRGSRFDVFLPRAARGATAEASAPLPQRDSRRGCETILVVEDEPALRALAREILELEGYSVLEADGAAAAARVAGQHRGPIHLLLSDVVMPGASGPRVAEAILRARPGTRVLFMSGHTAHAALDAAQGEGALGPSTHFIQKPFTPDGLVRAVAAALSSPRQPV